MIAGEDCNNIPLAVRILLTATGTGFPTFNALVLSRHSFESWGVASLTVHTLLCGFFQGLFVDLVDVMSANIGSFSTTQQTRPTLCFAHLFSTDAD